MKGSSNMTNFKINNRTISLTDDQLLLTKQIAILGLFPSLISTCFIRLLKVSSHYSHNTSSPRWLINYTFGIV